MNIENMFKFLLLNLAIPLFIALFVIRCELPNQLKLISYELEKNNDLAIRKQICYDLTLDAGKRLQALRALNRVVGDKKNTKYLECLKKNEELTVEWESKVHQYSILLIGFYSQDLCNEFHEKINDDFFHINLQVKNALNKETIAKNKMELDKLRDNFLHFGKKLVMEFNS